MCPLSTRGGRGGGNGHACAISSTESLASCPRPRSCQHGRGKPRGKGGRGATVGAAVGERVGRAETCFPERSSSIWFCRVRDLRASRRVGTVGGWVGGGDRQGGHHAISSLTPWISSRCCRTFCCSSAISSCASISSRSIRSRSRLMSRTYLGRPVGRVCEHACTAAR